MGDLLGAGARWLTDQRTANLAKPVVYQRGSNTVVLSATPAERKDEQVVANGVVEQTRSPEWLIRATDLTIAGIQIEPQNGDLIIETVNGKQYTNTVLSTGENPCWKWSDQEKTTMRIRTSTTAIA